MRRVVSRSSFGPREVKSNPLSKVTDWGFGRIVGQYGVEWRKEGEPDVVSIRPTQAGSVGESAGQKLTK